LALAGEYIPAAYCLDDSAVTAQVDALYSAGIQSFILGLPGSEPYAAYLEGRDLPRS
jgi:hypothetical protein